MLQSCGSEQDFDGDGVWDNCPTVVNPDQVDTDGDRTGDACDTCPNDPENDIDGDGHCGDNDQCPTDPNKSQLLQCGCGVQETDSDGDGIADCLDLCPSDTNKTESGVCGCGVSDSDSDGDGSLDCQDSCLNDPTKSTAGVCGCGVPETDSDGDGTLDCSDLCPGDAGKVAAGACGCGVPDTDSDGDGIPDCSDLCPSDSGKREPDACGCGVPDVDSDGDGALNCQEQCISDPAKVNAGVCGCGMSDTDNDGDGSSDCLDLCPSDPSKIEVGDCGCGVPDSDVDGDGLLDCADLCPHDSSKTSTGACGCGVSDEDTDGDGFANCQESCSADPAKRFPGVCGCGVPDNDLDGDGIVECQTVCEAGASPALGHCVEVQSLLCRQSTEASETLIEKLDSEVYATRNAAYNELRCRLDKLASHEETYNALYASVGQGTLERKNRVDLLLAYSGVSASGWLSLLNTGRDSLAARPELSKLVSVYHQFFDQTTEFFGTRYPITDAIRNAVQTWIDAAPGEPKDHARAFLESTVDSFFSSLADHLVAKTNFTNITYSFDYENLQALKLFRVSMQCQVGGEPYTLKLALDLGTPSLGLLPQSVIGSLQHNFSNLFTRAQRIHSFGTEENLPDMALEMSTSSLQMMLETGPAYRVVLRQPGVTFHMLPKSLVGEFLLPLVSDEASRFDIAQAIEKISANDGIMWIPNVN